MLRDTKLFDRFFLIAFSPKSGTCAASFPQGSSHQWSCFIVFFIECYPMYIRRFLRLVPHKWNHISCLNIVSKRYYKTYPRNSKEIHPKDTKHQSSFAVNHAQYFAGQKTKLSPNSIVNACPSVELYLSTFTSRSSFVLKLQGTSVRDFPSPYRVLTKISPLSPQPRSSVRPQLDGMAFPPRFDLAPEEF